MISFLMYCLLGLSCAEDIDKSFNTNNFDVDKTHIQEYHGIIPAAERLQLYLPSLKNKKVGLVINHTSMVGDMHLIDTLLSLEVDVQSIFTPEHGFKGAADAGEKVQDGWYKDIPLISLYGKNRKPSAQHLEDLDIIVFDIQDVGVRFYTYISTLHYVMEAAASASVPMIVLDRPNPNGYYVDGPILEDEFKSFVGMHNVPVVYGMTIGEYAQMINGESWLDDGLSVDLSVIPCLDYDHTMSYDLPIKPSPNLPNLRSILLYPSLCFFEGTNMSIGRGTQKQFQLIGHPSVQGTSFSFTPLSSAGAKSPKLMGQKCFGEDLSIIDVARIKSIKKINLKWIISYYKLLKEADTEFFIKDNGFFNKLAGTASLKQDIIAGVSEEQIRGQWTDGIAGFKQMRKKYLLYPDFE